jgi:predicted amidohydrolase YtcJ
VAVHSDFPVSMPDWCDALYGLTARSLSPKAFDVFYRRIAGASYTLDTSVDPREDICCPLPGRKECIGIDAAVEVITKNGAASMSVENARGIIAPGMAADIVMLDRDISGMIRPGSEKCSRNILTICGGNVVYEA